MTNTPIESDSTLVFDNVESVLYGALMARYRKLIASLSRQVTDDSRGVAALSTEREGLRKAAMRFQELEEIARPKEERLEIAASMLLNMPQSERGKKGSSGVTEDEYDEDAALIVPVPIERLDLSQYPLWKIIREIVRHASGIQVVQIERALKDFGIKTRRQSIESALTVHKKEFKTMKRGREKFVSLK